MDLNIEGFIPSVMPITILERLLMPSLTDVLVTILALIMLLCTVLVLHLLRYH